MKLIVKNFGPIREAKDIGISALTIFAGPGNTGKSQLAMLVYSIVKMLADEELDLNVLRRIMIQNYFLSISEFDTITEHGI